jgi:hypothetical protein
MSTVKAPENVTSEQVVAALRNGLDGRYQVQPGKRMRRSPLLGPPRPAAPELIVVTGGTMVQAQVTVIPRAGRTDLQVTPGGILGDLVMNTLGVARKVRQALLSDPTLKATTPTQ